MNKPSRAERSEALEAWADAVHPDDLEPIDASDLQAIAKLAHERTSIEERLDKAVRSAREGERSWSQIGAMLGVSKQAAQQKYGSRAR